jgi:iron complex outermembrane receptor protein
MKLKFDYLTRCLLLLLVAMGMSSLAVAQRTVKGTVTDGQSGDPLIGANILVVGTSVGTITDVDGTYSLQVPAGATEIEVTYTGYGAQRVTIGASNTIDVALTAGELLEEIVVTGYGTQKSKEVTSAITSIKAEDFNQGQVNNPLQLVQGKVAGLSISQPGSDPNGSPAIRLRGLSTLGANTSPLVVIDGVIGASLQTVDPNDIASIDVLKDGSAAAIYGSRASSGVIIVTTKKGVKGSTNLEYNAYLTTEAIAKSVDIADRGEFLRLREVAYRHFNPNASASDVSAAIAALDRGSDTDWMGEVTRNAISHVHNVSMSGGVGNGTSYRAAFNYRDIQGVGINTGFKQLNGRLNLTQKALNDRLTLGLNVSATERRSQYGFNQAFYYATTYNPTAPVLWDSKSPIYNAALDLKYGGYYQQENFDYFNPVAIAEQNTNEGNTKDLLVNVRGDYELIDGLTYSLSYSQQKESGLFGEFYPSTSYFRGFNEKGLATRRTEDRSTELLESTLKYDIDLSGNQLTLLGGYSYQEFTSEGFSAQATRFITNDLNFNNLNFGQRAALGDPNAVGSYKDRYKVIGFFGRANLNIDDTYYIMASVRREGSSRFGKENRWGIFPAASVGADLAKIADISGVDQLKLRVAYGVTGSLPPSSYLSQFLYSRQGNFFFNGEFVPAIGPSRNANPDLKWEQKGEFDAGIDFALMDYKLTGSFDFYNRTTNDLIYEVTVPQPPNFARRTWANLEDVALKSQGIELSLGYRAIDKGDLTWEPRLVFSTYKTTLDLVDAENPTYKFFTGTDPVTYDFSTSPGAPGQNDDPTIGVFGGEELGQIVGPVFEGVTETGDWKFKDVNGDGKVETGLGQPDRVVIGNGLPDFSLGLQSTLNYGNFDFGFFLRGDFGHDLVNMYRNFYETLGNASSRPIENQVVTDLFREDLFGQPKYSSFAVEKASYVCLDNATIGYNFKLPTEQKIRLYLTGRNLFYITDYTGVDPSVRYSDVGNGEDNGGRPSGNNPLAPGLDRRSTYFRSYSVSIGANVTF